MYSLPNALHTGHAAAASSPATHASVTTRHGAGIAVLVTIIVVLLVVADERVSCPCPDQFSVHVEGVVQLVKGSTLLKKQ